MSSMQTSKAGEIDIFKADKSTISTQKFVFAIWRNRANVDLISELTIKMRYG